MRKPESHRECSVNAANRHIELTDEPLDVASILATVTHECCGAEVLFVGTTRRWTVADDDPIAEAEADLGVRSPETSHLVYECYREMAFAEMQRLADEAVRRWPVRRLAMAHRVGRVDPTEPSVAVAVSCPHRGEAFESARWLIDSLKHEVPIWKREHYVQQGAEWIHPGSGSCRCVDRSAS